MTQPNAPVTAEIRKLQKPLEDCILAAWKNAPEDSPMAHLQREAIVGAILPLLATFVAERERLARLDETNLWDAKQSPIETLDHEYHVGFDARCGECRRKRIAQLESAGTERSEKS